MRWARPKSLTGLMLLGLALIAVPLLVAVVDAVIQIRRLAAQSEELVQEGVQGARLFRVRGGNRGRKELPRGR